MDTQWQTETDLRLNALQSQLRSTRQLAVALAVAVVALAAWAVVGIVRKPTKIELTGPDGSLTLEPSEINLKVGKASFSVDVGGMWLRDEDAKSKRWTGLHAGRVEVSTDGESMASLNALGDNASFSLMSSKSSSIATLKSSPTGSELTVIAPHDHSVTLTATPTGAKVTGIGATFFGLGDDAPVAPAPPPPPPPAPGPPAKPAK
jgi:hypothetical protein